MKYDFATVALWAIAVLVTFLLVDERGVVTRLAPLYTICMIGSVMVVRRARISK